MKENITILQDAHQAFVRSLKDQKKASATILAYGKDISQLVEFMTKKQMTQASLVLPEHLEEFKEYLAENKYIAKSISRKLNSIRTFFRFLQDEKVVDKNPALTVAHPKYEIKAPRILTKIEYRALRDAVRDDPRLAAIVEVLLQTGIRISELSRLEIKDIGEKEAKIVAWESHPQRIVPISPAAKKSIERYLKIRPATKSRNVFITKSGRPLLIRNIRTAVDRYFKIAGIENATVNDLRHTFAAHQLMRGASVTFVQQLIGHKRLSTTEKYVEYIKDKIEPKDQLEEL